MEVQKTIAGNSCELFVTGRIDGDGAHLLDRALSEVVFGRVKDGADAIKTIYVNLSTATFLGSAGFGHLMRYRLSMRKRGGQLFVTRPSLEVTEVLKMAGLFDLLAEKM